MHHCLHFKVCPTCARGDAQSTDLTNGEKLPTLLMGQNLTVSLAKGVTIEGEASNATVTIPNITADKVRIN